MWENLRGRVSVVIPLEGAGRTNGTANHRGTENTENWACPDLMDA
jgi:hypothetical protein